MGVFETAISQFYSDDIFNRIQSLKIGIAGAGGIGSNCAGILVRCGFKRFMVVDFDRVEPSNLNRQMYLSSHIGKMKAECLKEILLSINPDVAIDFACERITKINAAGMFRDCDVVIEAFDNALSKAELFSVFLHSGKLLVGVSGIGGIGNCGKIDILRVSSNVVIVGDRVSEVNDMVRPYAPRVMAASSMMADVILDFIVNGHKN
jgi:sulfur carrier protein ThiS adenylyltransferase